MRRRLALAATATGLCVTAAGLISSTPAPAANTCPGRNGEVAVVAELIANPNPEKMQIGILGANRQLQTIYTSVGGNFISNPTFSCDGKTIAFTEGGGEPGRALAVVNVASGESHFVPTQRLTGNFPAFLTNGKIVFSGSRGNPGRQGGTYVVDPDGSHLRRLFGRQEIAASPDGRWFIATDPHGNFRRLYLLNAKGRTVHPLTGTSPKGTEYLNPHFSPDGRWIVYEELRFLGVSQHSVLYMVRRDGTHRRRLTFGAESAAQPTFSPDGRWIAFTRSKDKPNGNVYAMSLHHPAKVRKLGLSWGYQAPAWAPR